MTTYAELPPLVATDWLTPEEIFLWRNNPHGEMAFGIIRAKGRFLYQYRSDDFPTDPTPGNYWYDSSGELYQFTQRQEWRKCYQ